MRNLSLLTIGLVSLVILPLASAIYGGEPVQEDAYPFMVHLYLDEPHDGLVCGGSLIAPTYVLTAGHCVVGNRTFRDQIPVIGPYIGEGRTVNETQALIGCMDLQECGEEHHFQVVAGFQHPEYTNNGLPMGALMPGNDIAVLELDRPAPFETVRPATQQDLPLYPAGTSARVLGWGCTPDACFPDHPQVLHQVDVPIWSDPECSAASNYMLMYHPETELCAGEEGKDSCGGDSGGPLYLEYEDGPVVVGIVSYGSLYEVNTDDPLAGFVPCGSGEHPGVYTEVAAYEEFLAPFV